MCRRRSLTVKIMIKIIIKSTTTTTGETVKSQCSNLKRTYRTNILLLTQILEGREDSEANGHSL